MASISPSQIVLLLAIFCSGVVAYMAHSRRAPASDGLTVTCLGVCLSLGTYLTFPSSITNSPTAVAAALSLSGSILIVGGWLYLSAAFSENEWLFEGYWFHILLAPLVFTAGVHWAGTIWPLVLDTGPVRTLDATFAPYSYGLVAFSVVLLGRYFLSVEGVYRRQTAYLMVAPLSPLLTAELFNFELVPLPPGMFAIGYVPTLLLTLYALHSHNLLDIVPIARETVVNNMSDAVISVTSEGIIASINDPGKELLDVDEAVVGKPLGEGLAAWPTILEAIDADEERQVSIGDQYMRVVVTPIEKNGTEYGSVVHLRDITFEVERRQELRRKQEQLEKKNEQLDEFASVVSHDIRNPLNVAQGHLEIIADDVEDPDAVEKISRSHERIENIVNSLLDLAKNGRSVDTFESVPFGDVVERARVSVGVPTEQLVFGGPDELRADPSRLQQLLENLFRNSLQHGGEQVTIRVGPLDDESGFYVADDGPGIPDDDRPQVFEYGYTDSVDGTGFGLNIVKSIVEAHDWQVEIVDSTDGGARFQFLTGPETAKEDPVTASTD